VFFVLSAGALRSGTADEALRELPRLPSAPSALFADKVGYLYAFVPARVYVLDLRTEPSQWKYVDLANVMDLTINQEGKVFARCDLGASHAFYDLKGSSPELILKRDAFPCKAWYVDGANRIWLQNEEKLIVAGPEAEPLVVVRPHGAYGFRLRNPCEWQPGHVVLFYGTAMVWAGPESVEVKAAPQFAADGTGNGPLRLGEYFLVSGGGNNEGRGSYLIDAGAPEAGPRRIGLGWDWFHGVASAPDGRALVLAQTDRNPVFTLFWYAPDGRTDVRLQGAEDLLRAGLSREALPNLKIVFNKRSEAFVVLKSGLLGYLRADTARILTPFLGLPVEQLVDLAALDDYLVMAGSDGRVFLWDTNVPLTPLSSESFDAREEWTLGGPCCVDVAGKMWAFLADFPGKLSCYDGRHWDHHAMELGNREPRHMTADDLGNLQISFQDYPAGGCLYAKGEFHFWPDGPASPWRESLRLGAKRFFDGSAFRTQEWTDGSGKGWFYNGRTLWDGSVEVTYDRPPYAYWWVDSEKDWYRLSGKQAMVYRDGRWRTPGLLPELLFLDSGGFRMWDSTMPNSNLGQWLSVTLRGGTAYALTSQTMALGDAEGRGPLSGRSVRPDVILQPSRAGGGGWVGCDRYVLGVFPVSSRGSKVYEAECGRFFLESEGKRTKLKLHRPRELTITGDVTKADDAWTVNCKVTADPPPDEPCLVVAISGAVTEILAIAKTVRIPLDLFREQQVTIYAVDRLGDISSEPFSLRVPKATFVLDTPPRGLDHRGPRWRVWPNQLSKGGPNGKPLLIGRHLAIDPDGNVWTTTSDARILLRCTLAEGKWELVEAPAPMELFNSPDGRAWGVATTPDGSMEASLYSVGGKGIERVTGVYDDSGYRPRPIAWDTEGNMWTCALRWVGCWNGDRWREWERPVGYGAQIRTGPGGMVLVLCDRGLLGFLVCAHGEPGDFRTLPDGWRFRWECYLLGQRYLVGPCVRGDFTGPQESATGIYDLDTGELDLHSLPFNAVFRPDGQGNLYVWKRQTEEFFLLRGEDKRQLGLLYCPPPAYENYVGEKGFLRTKDGMLIYSKSPESVIAWTAEGGPQEYGPQQGITKGTTWAMAEDAFGRVWMVRDSQLLLFDPESKPEGE